MALCTSIWEVIGYPWILPSTRRRARYRCEPGDRRFMIYLNPTDLRVKQIVLLLLGHLSESLNNIVRVGICVQKG